MGRPRTFNSISRLDDILRQFWSRGYHATSVENVCATAGLSKSSLYATFGDKHALLLQTLDRYIEVRIGHIRVVIEGAPSLREGINTLAGEIIDDIVTGSGRRGCFIGNCAIEIARDDRGTMARIRKGIGKMEEIFAGALERAQSDGEIDDGTDIKALARFLVAGFQGLRLVGKAKPNREFLEDIANTMLTCVKWKDA